MAPIDLQSEEFSRSTAQFRHRSWESFAEHVYSLEETAESENAPAEDDSTSAHFPAVVRYDDRLVRFGALSGIRESLFSEDFKEVVRRLVALSTPTAEASE